MKTGWLRDHELSLSAKKSEAVLSSRSKKLLYATFTVENMKIMRADSFCTLVSLLMHSYRTRRTFRRRVERHSIWPKRLLASFPMQGDPNRQDRGR